MKTDRPVGKLTFDHSEEKQSPHAIYINLFYKDENGDTWTVFASSFIYDFKRVEQNG
jgi:hypothetical protein